MKRRKLNLNLLIALFAALVMIPAFTLCDDSSESRARNNSQNNELQSGDSGPGNTDFTLAANHTINGVVHVKTLTERKGGRSPLEFFFGPQEREQERQPQEGMGSGVIITADGYIVTNHHVIAEADEIEVTLHDQRTYSAEVVGQDPNTDIAILKIDETDLSFIDIGNSDDLEVGEWVLAVGNPFGLTSSVTAGIISAKERSLGALQGGDMPIESFLQTDAAVNMGNSGGALVNLKGELIGVPTLIISPTRTYIGNSFAIPSVIVERVKDDIIEFGEVRRGILGVSIRDVTSELAEEEGIETIEGVYVEYVINGSAAGQAGVQRGDVILEVNGNPVNSPSGLQLEISRHHPGERVELLIMRDGSRSELTAELITMEEHNELVMQQQESLLGATFRMVPEDLKEKLELPGGVQVTEIESGQLQSAGMREGFIIVGINNQLVQQPSHVLQLLEDYSGNVVIQGVYPDGSSATYAFNI